MNSLKNAAKRTRPKWAKLPTGGRWVRLSLVVVLKTEITHVKCILSLILNVFILIFYVLLLVPFNFILLHSDAL